MRIFVLTATTLSFTLTPIVTAFPAPQGNGLWASICSGVAPIWISLDDEGTPPPPQNHSKACHAVCCSRDDDEKDNNDGSNSD